MPEPRRKMSLGLSIANLGYHYAAWRHPRVPAGGNMDFRHFLHCAKLAERGKFDLIFLADSSAVRESAPGAFIMTLTVRSKVAAPIMMTRRFIVI